MTQKYKTLLLIFNAFLSIFEEWLLPPFLLVRKVVQRDGATIFKARFSFPVAMRRNAAYILPEHALSNFMQFKRWEKVMLEV